MKPFIITFVNGMGLVLHFFIASSLWGWARKCGQCSQNALFLGPNMLMVRPQGSSPRSRSHERPGGP